MTDNDHKEFKELLSHTSMKLENLRIRVKHFENHKDTTTKETLDLFLLEAAIDALKLEIKLYRN